jgi:hypothetical protein
MATKKKGPSTKYCRIFQWIEDKDPAFAEVIHFLCLEGQLSPNKRAPGVTFLYPKEKAYRDKIIDMRDSDADEAARLIESLIIPDVLLQGSDFQRRPVGSRLGVKYDVEPPVERGRVKLSCGVELALADDFHTLARREGQLAIWNVTKGQLPTSGDRYAPPLAERKARLGGARAGDDRAGERARIAAKTAEEFDHCMRADGCRERNPYLAKVVSLLNCLKMKYPDLLTTILPALDYEPFVSFYLLLEPHKTEGFLIPDEVLAAWGGADLWIGNAVENYEAMFAAVAAQQAACAKDPQTGQPVVPYVFRDRQAVASEVDGVRQNIDQSSTFRGAMDLVHNAYANLATNNAIGGVAPVAPDANNAVFTAARRLWADEFRFVHHEALQALRAAPYSAATFHGIATKVCAAWPGNNYGAETYLTNMADMKGNAYPRTELMLLMKFVNSTDFLYMASPPDLVGAPGGSMDPKDRRVYNRSAVALGNLRRITGMVHADGVSPSALQELALYAQANGGQLPPAVAALFQR